jgi:hypothetical protein
LPTWAYYEIFETTDDVHNWNYYDLQTTYTYNLYEKQGGEIYLNYNSSLGGSLGKTFGITKGDNTFQLLHINGTAIDFTIPTVKTDISEYYNSGYWALSMNGENKPMYIFNSSSIYIYEALENQITIEALTSTAIEKIVNWQNVISWGQYDDSTTYHKLVRVGGRQMTNIYLYSQDEFSIRDLETDIRWAAKLRHWVSNTHLMSLKLLNIDGSELILNDLIYSLDGGTYFYLEDYYNQGYFAFAQNDSHSPCCLITADSYIWIPNGFGDEETASYDWACISNYRWVNNWKTA